jgi:hypothetical protein
LSCDPSGDGKTDVTDLTLVINQVLGLVPCTKGDLNGDGRCEVTDAQTIVNSILSGTCSATRVIEISDPVSCRVTTTGPGMLSLYSDGKNTLVAFQPEGWMDLSRPPPSTYAVSPPCVPISLYTVLFDRPKTITPMLRLWDVR